jgi:hypothetical protein
LPTLAKSILDAIALREITECDRLIEQKQPRIDVKKPPQSLSLFLADF